MPSNEFDWLRDARERLAAYERNRQEHQARGIAREGENMPTSGPIYIANDGEVRYRYIDPTPAPTPAPSYPLFRHHGCVGNRHEGYSSCRNFGANVNATRWAMPE